jgi:CBS domain-containing protein
MPTAKDIMNPSVASIRRDATAAEAVQQMNDGGISSLIVEKSNPRDSFGIVTMGDVVCKVVSSGISLEAVHVHEIMTKPLIFAPPDMSIKHVARLLANNDISRVPVLENNQLAGIITFHDILADLGLIETKM